MFSATDIASFLACPHTATLDRAESNDEIVKPFFKDAAVDRLRKLGLEHEQRYLRELAEKGGLSIAHIGVNGRFGRCRCGDSPCIARRRRCRLPSHVSGRSVGWAVGLPCSGQRAWRPRFLVSMRSWKPSSRTPRGDCGVSALLLSDLLTRIQATEPLWIHVLLGGTAVPERFQVQQCIAYFRKVRSEFERVWKLETDTYPEPTEHCHVYSWFFAVRRAAETTTIFHSGREFRGINRRH